MTCSLSRFGDTGSEHNNSIPPGPTCSYPMDADQASHTQPEQMIELLFPELLPPTSLLSVTNKQIPHLPTSRTKGLNLGAPRDRGSPGVRGEAEETGKRPKHQGSEEATRSIFFFFKLGAEPGWAVKIYVCVCV